MDAAINTGALQPMTCAEALEVFKANGRREFSFVMTSGVPKTVSENRKTREVTAIAPSTWFPKPLVVIGEKVNQSQMVPGLMYRAQDVRRGK